MRESPIRTRLLITTMSDPDEVSDAGADVPEYETVDVSVLLIGAGAAGARTAIELAECGVEDVLVLGKRSHGDAHTTWARGGINGALGTQDPEDSWAIHAADTLNEGHFLNDPQWSRQSQHRCPIGFASSMSGVWSFLERTMGRSTNDSLGHSHFGEPRSRVTIRESHC